MRRNQLTRVDSNFKNWLNKIKLGRKTNGLDKKHRGDASITREMMKMPSMKKVERQLLFGYNKGAITDLFVLIIVAFIFVLFFAGWIFIHGQITDLFVSIPAESSNGVTIDIGDAAEKTAGPVNSSFSVWYWMLGFIIFGMFIAFLISNWLVSTNPFFIGIYILVLIIVIIVSVVFSNVYQDLRTNEILGGNLRSAVISDYIFMYLPIWVTVFGFLGAILLFINISRQEDIDTEGIS